MAANTTPIFPLTPNIGFARLSAANTARDGSGSITTVFTAGANGSRVDQIIWTSAQATAAANSAMVGRIFVTDTSGTNPRLIGELAISAVTASNTAIGAQQIYTFVGGLVLASGQLIKVCQSVYASAADQMDVIAKGADY